jgi:hypothetical protein
MSLVFFKSQNVINLFIQVDVGDSINLGDVTPTKTRSRQEMRPIHFNKQMETSAHLGRQHFES